MDNKHLGKVSHRSKDAKVSYKNCGVGARALGGLKMLHGNAKALSSALKAKDWKTAMKTGGDLAKGGW